jgi:Protein of unknown function (DUF4238)
MIEQAHKHHFIPPFYLKGWANGDRLLVEYSRPHKVVKPQRRHPNATKYQRDLYSFNDLPPDIAQHIESNFFKSTDDVADIVLRRMLAGDLNIYEPQHRNGWSRFIVSLQLRHSDAIAELRMELPCILAESEDDMEEHYQQIRTSANPPTFQEYATGSNLMLPGRLQLYMLQAVLDNRLGGQWLNDLRWSTLGVSKAAYTLLISDWPLHLMRMEKGW